MQHAPVESDLKLDILTQPDEISCGPTCLHAVLRYYGESLSLDEVISRTERLREGGTLAVFLGCMALELGYAATIYTYNLQVFDPTWAHLPPSELTERLRRQAMLKPEERIQVGARAFARFLQGGGIVRFDDLTPELVRRVLSRRMPILTGLSSTYLFRSAREIEREGRHVNDDVAGQPMGHFVVLSGYEKALRLVQVADPWGHDESTPRAGKYWIHIQRVINSILLGIVTYDANLLVIRPKKERVASRQECRQPP